MDRKKSALWINAEYLAMLALVFAARRLPVRLSLKAAAAVGFFVYLLDFKHRRRAVQHILHSGIVSGAKEARGIARKCFVSFAKMAFEVFNSDRIINQSNVKERVSFNMPEEIKNIALTERAILVSAHYGNWELAARGCAFQSNHPLVSVMRPLDNPKMGALIYKQREFHNHTALSKEKGLRALLSAMKKGASAVIVSDQHASSSEGVETVFFGHPARSHAAPAILHIMTGAPLIASVFRRLDDSGHFEFISRRVIRYQPTGDREADIRTVTQMYTSDLEELIRLHPEQWNWIHRRWLDINRKSSHKKAPDDEKGKN